MFCCWRGRKSKSQVHHTDDQNEEVVVIPPYENRQDISDTKRHEEQDSFNTNDYESDVNGSLEVFNTTIESTFKSKREERTLSPASNSGFLDQGNSIIPNSFSPDIVVKRPYQPKAGHIDLCIVVKTAMFSNFCYLGFDFERKRLYRPIYETTEGQCCWDTDMTVDSIYTFQVLQFSNAVMRPITPIPHGNDDLLVEHSEIVRQSENNTRTIYRELESIAKSSMGEIFKGISRKKYVRELTDSPSAGVFRCHGSDIKVMNYTEHGKTKIRIKIGGYYFPYTGLDSNNERTSPNVKSDSQVLVILGLARPWEGKKSQYSPKRCGILVLRILQQPE